MMQKSLPAPESESEGIDSSLKSEWLRFAESTSIKGVPKVLRSSQLCVRAMWLFAVVFGASFAVYQVYYIISKYLQYKTSLQIEELREEPPFPDISVCKMNPPPLIADLDSIIENTQMRYTEYEDDEYWYHNDEGYETLELAKELDGLTGYFQSDDASNVQMENIHNFAVQCSFMSWNSVIEDCNKSLRHESFFLTPEYPTCVTFRPNTATTRKELLGFTGIFYLNDFTEEDIPDLERSLLNSQAKGVKVFLHEPNTTPNILLGAPVSPGVQGTIRIHAELYERLSEPYGNCHSGNQTNETLHGTHDDNPVYTEHGCENMCTQNLLLEKCKCLDPNIPTSEGMRENNSFCGALDDDYDDMMNRTLRNLNCRKREINGIMDTCQDMCLPLCSEYYFRYQKLDAKWPHENRHLELYHVFYNTFKDSEHEMNEQLRTYYDDVSRDMNNHREEEAFEKLRKTDLITRNFLQVNVHFDARMIVRYTDTELMSMSEMFGNLGGVLNLWIGVTFITFIEFGELMYNVIFLLGYKMKTKVQAKEISVAPMPKSHDSGSTVGDIFTNTEKTKYSNDT